MIRYLAIVGIAVSPLALAQDAPAPAAPAAPQIEQLDGTRMRIGSVTLDRKTREIRFPAKVNMTQGLLEYLVCMQQGKIHEALFITETSPTHLNVAFKLLRYQASPELFSTLDKDGLQTGRFPAVPEAVKAAARLAIDVEWTVEGKTRRVAVNEWIQHSVTGKSMMAGPWLYTGSDFNEGKYMAEVTGDIAGMMGTLEAVINYPGSDNGDNVWLSYPKRVPPEGTPVTLIITPYQSNKESRS